MNWTCPHCSRTQLASSQNHTSTRYQLHVGETRIGEIGYSVSVQRCLNKECNLPTVSAQFGRARVNPHGSFGQVGSEFFDGRLYPHSAAKPQPGYIPAAIVEDYSEACKIVDLSPKAAATLARRCLQGMIRDFAGIQKPSLFKEIEALKSAIADGSADRAISEESVEAIDAVRGIGNIGAHMEKDVNHIVGVDAGEAQVLIELIEQLFEEWYGAHNSREERLAKVKVIAVQKAADKVAAIDSVNLVAEE